MKVSIITCTFNNANFIESCLKSVSSQDYHDIEHIVIDGGSSDGTKEIVKERYLEKVDVFISEPDDGVYDALNKGISKATGDVIGFMHADDYFHTTNIISKMVQKLHSDALDGVYGDLNYVSKQEDGPKVIRYWRSGVYDTKKLAKGWMPPHPTLYLKKSVYDKWGTFDKDFQIAADYELMMRVLKQGEIKIGYLPRVLINMRVGGKSNKSLSNILLKMREDYKVIKRHKIGGFYTLIFKNTSKIIQFVR